MVDNIKIGEKEIEMRADGATPFLYKQAFGKDIIKIFMDANENENYAEANDLSAELGFVMAQQAKSPDPLNVNLSKGEFMRWLSQFEPLDLTADGMAIIDLFVGTLKTDSIAKKKEELPIEK